MVPMRGTADDVPAVMLLIGRVFAEYGLLLIPLFEVPDLLQFDAHYTAPRGAFWIVRDGTRVVGSVGVDRKDERAAELKRLYVDATLRGRGIGQRLVETVLDWTREQGIPRLVLWTMLVLAIGLVVYWTASARTRFVGPPRAR